MKTVSFMSSKFVQCISNEHYPHPASPHMPRQVHPHTTHSPIIVASKAVSKGTTICRELKEVGGRNSAHCQPSDNNLRVGNECCQEDIGDITNVLVELSNSSPLCS